MSSATFLFLSSPHAFQSRCYCRSPVPWDRNYCVTGKSGDGDHRGSSRRLAMGRWNLQSDGRNQGIYRNFARSAGIGRYSGAIHGGSQRKRTRRRPPIQQDDDECDGSASTIEHDDREAQAENENDEAHEEPDFSTADGTSSGDLKITSGDDVDSTSHNDADSASNDEIDTVEEDFEYRRYLQEMGVITRVNDDSSDIVLRSGLLDLPVHHDHNVHDEQSEDNESEHMGHVSGKSSVAPAANIDELNQAVSVGSGVEAENDGSGVEDSEKPKVRANSEASSEAGGMLNVVPTIPTSQEVETEALSDTDSDAPRDKDSEELGEYDNKGSENDIVGSERSEKETSIPAKDEIETKSSVWNEAILASKSDISNSERSEREQKAGNGFALNPKKQSMKILEISSANSSLELENDVTQFVRVVASAAELSANTPITSSCEAENGPQESMGMIGNVSSVPLDGELEPMIAVKTAEIPGSESFSVIGTQSIDEETFKGSGTFERMAYVTEKNVQMVTLTEMNSNLRKDWSIGATPAESYVEDSSMIALGNAGVAISLPTISTDELTLPTIAAAVLEQAVQVGSVVVDQVVEILPDSVTDRVGQVVDQVTDVAEQLANTVNEQVQQVAQNVSSTATQVAEQVTSSVEIVATSTSQMVEQVSDFIAAASGGDDDGDDDTDSDSDDEFEAYKTSDLPEFRGKKGIENFIVKQEGQGVLSRIYDFYSYMLKQPLPEFAMAMFAAPMIVSAIFTVLYLPQFDGLAFDETARDFFGSAGGDAPTLHLSWKTLFQVFMFSLSLATGLQPELAPLSPYALVVANLNALVAQLVFVFLSGAVFARLSQPSQPVRCSNVALVSATPAQRKRKDLAIKVLSARYVLAGPQPCELVDVKVDLVYKYNTYTRIGTYFRATQSLKLVRPEVAFCTHGMLIRHVIDDRSPLYQRTPEMLKKEDAVFCLSVVGLERASMQPVFHVQHYCVVDDHVIWDADFEDLILINKKNKRIVDHSRLSMWRRYVD